MPDRVDPLFSTERMSGVFSGEARVGAMLRFESALARAEARAGIVPERAAEAIAGKCDVGLFDVPSLEEEALVAGTLAVPLVRRLTDLVGDEAQGFVHWGATSQDAIDTAMVLQAREGLDALTEDLMGLGAACAELAERHAATPMPGRTLLQHALPITFGLKAARWLGLATRQLERLARVRAGLPVQFGGAAGTLAALGGDGIRVAELLAEELGLAVPDLPWHAERDVVAELAASVGIVAGGTAKIATDVALLTQTEVAEVAEGQEEGAGRSSTLPQKRNPVHATWAVASARLALGTVPVVLSAMVQEHERAVGGWQAEWAAIPDLFRFTAGAVHHARAVAETLEVDPERMRANLGLGEGSIMAEALMMALAPHLGRDRAYGIVAEASQRAARAGIDLREAAAEDERIQAVLSPDALEAVFDPASYLGSTEAFVRLALERYRSVAESEAKAWRT